MRRWFRRAVPAALVVVVAVLALGGEAGAAPTLISSLPWPHYSGMDPTKVGNNVGECNENLVLPPSGGFRSSQAEKEQQFWGFSVGCQMAASGGTLFNWSDAANLFTPRIGLPGGQCGNAPTCTQYGLSGDPDPAPVSNQFGTSYTYTSPFATGGCSTLPSTCIVFSAANTGAPSTVASGCALVGATTNFCGGDFLWNWQSGGLQQWLLNHSCAVNDGYYEYLPGVGFNSNAPSSSCTAAVTANNLPATACVLQDWQASAMATSSKYAVQFRFDCIFIPQNNDVPIRAASANISDCFNYSAGVAQWQTNEWLSVTSTCVSFDGDPEAPVPDSYWTGGNPVDQGACSDATISPNPYTLGEVTAGTSYPFTITYSNPADTGFVLGYHDQGGTVTLAGAPSGSYWDPGSTYYPATTSPMTVSWVANRSWKAALQFYCINGGNIYTRNTGGVGDGSAAPDQAGCTNFVGGTSPTTAVGCAVNLSQCVSNINVGLDPVSWVPAILQGIGCVLAWAFIPEEIYTSQLTSPFTGHFPGTWIVDGTSGVSTIRGGLATATLASACDPPSFGTGSFSVAGHSLSVSGSLPGPSSQGCTQPGASTSGELYGYRGDVRDFLTFLVWLGAALVVWRMMPWWRNKADDLPTTGQFEDDGSYGYTVE